MGHARDITVKNIWSSESISAGAGVTSSAYDLGSFGDNGFVSLQVEVAGTGVSIAFDYIVSNSGIDYLKPSATSYGGSIANQFTATSGTDSDGKDLITFEPELARFIKICANETASSTGATATVNAWLAIQ